MATVVNKDISVSPSVSASDESSDDIVAVSIDATSDVVESDVTSSHPLFSPGRFSKGRGRFTATQAMVETLSTNSTDSNASKVSTEKTRSLFRVMDTS